MKRIVLCLSLLSFFTTSAQAFESGTYECEHSLGTITFVLNDNGRAKQIMMGTTTRGNWQDNGNEALIINKDTIIEKIGMKYIMPSNGIAPDNNCKKAKKGEEFKSINNASFQNNLIIKAVVVEQNKTQEQKNRDLAKYKAKEFIKNYESNKKRADLMKSLPLNVQKKILLNNIKYPFSQYTPELKKMVIEELNNLGVKIPTINE